ncbi:MAG TPA: hemerythrin domain-containing protein [Albitalea sp.]|uniref:hemerythrin domain-containing protein n=1 Tax=Piscinibacter sp. TaxID=1903157 RepID=UPI002ED16749
MIADTLAPRHAPRYDLYAGIHKAARAFMTDTLGRIGRLDVTDDADTRAALTQLEALLAFCEKHLQHENEFVHPAIEAREPGSAGRIAAEHREHLEAIAALREDARQLLVAALPQRASLALRLYRHLALFVAENFEHMHVEETLHNATLWTHYSDEELHALHGRLKASIAPPDMLEVLRWLVPALTPAERAGMLNGAKAEMPATAFQAMVGYVRPHLDATAWNKLAPAIGVERDPRFAHVG